MSPRNLTGVKVGRKKTASSTNLDQLLKQAHLEANRPIVIQKVSPNKSVGFLGQVSWGKNDILIKIKNNLDAEMNDYIMAHELSHAIQYSRGFPIAVGKINEPLAIKLAILISDFILDSAADTISINNGFNPTVYFEKWFRSTGQLEQFDRPIKPEGFGLDWERVWKTIEQRPLNTKLESHNAFLTRDFWTMYIALDVARDMRRAKNLGLKEIFDHMARDLNPPMLSRVVNDLLNIYKDFGDFGPTECRNQLINVLDYFNGRQCRSLFIYKPLTNEFYKDGNWDQLTLFNYLFNGSPPLRK